MKEQALTYLVMGKINHQVGNFDVDIEFYRNDDIGTFLLVGNASRDHKNTKNTIEGNSSHHGNKLNVLRFNY